MELTKKDERIFAQGAELLGLNAQALGAMALLAHKYADDKHALEVLRLAYGRDAKGMARAVEYFPEEFDANALPSASPGALLSLFALGRLSEKRALTLYTQAKDFTANYYEVVALIEGDEAARRKARAQGGHISLRNYDFRPQRVSANATYRVTLIIPYREDHAIVEAIELARGNANIRIAAAKKIGRPRKET